MPTLEELDQRLTILEKEARIVKAQESATSSKLDMIFDEQLRIKQVMAQLFIGQTNIASRFDKLEVRFDKLEVRFDKLEAEVKAMPRAIIDELKAYFDRK